MIILNYATKPLLEKCINNLLSAWENCEVIFVDNDSPDGSADLVQELFGNNPKVTLIRTKNNGLAAGYNLGLEKATGDYYLYLGTDAFPTHDSLERLVSYMDEHSDVGIATARLFIRDGSPDMDAHRGFPTPWVAITHYLFLDRLFPKSKIFNGYTQEYNDLTTVHEIDACISHFMFVRPEVHQKIGKWDADYFLYGEDIDFCYRVKEAGFKVMYTGDIEVLHYKGASVGRDTSKDIDNVMNKNFSYVSIKDERVELKKPEQPKVATPENKEPLTQEQKEAAKKIKSTRLWMKLRIARVSTEAMRIFYKKHLMKKYPIFLTGLVFIGIWVTEQKKVLTVLWNFYVKGK